MYEEKGFVVIPTSFDEVGLACARSVAEFLKLFELESVLGQNFGGGEVSKGVRERIEAAFFVVAILSRDVQVGDGTWRAPEWVIQEIAWAKAHEKDCLLLVEEGVSFNGGILGDVEYLSFKADSFSDVLVPLGHQVRSLLSRHLLTTGIKKVPVYTHVSDEPLRNECTDEAKLLILKIRHLAKQQRYEEAQEVALTATRICPAYWRAWTSLGALLVRLGKIEEGDKVFAQVLKDFPDSSKGMAAALHNRAWVQEIKRGFNASANGLKEQARLYEKALKLDDPRVNTRACLLICRLLLNEKHKAERLLKDSILYEGFLDALRYELDTRGARAHKVLPALPKWLRHLLYPIRPGTPDGCDY